MAVRAQYDSAASTSPLKTPAAGALLLHLTVFGSIFVWAFIQGHLHHDLWGSNQREGAIQATLVSSAPALPLPRDQPPTPNVLATETPSPAPAAEAPPTKAAAPEPDAIPIPIKQPPKAKAPPAKQAQPPSPPRPLRLKNQPTRRSTLSPFPSRTTAPSTVRRLRRSPDP